MMKLHTPTQKIKPQQSHTLAMQSSVLPTQTDNNLDISSLFGIMLPMMVMVMMMKVMGSVVGGSTKSSSMEPVEAS